MPEQTVDVYCVPLDVAPDCLERSRAWLDRDETARAERFVFDIHRRRFTAARTALRGLLSRELRVAPMALAFGYGPRGKPRLAEPNPGALRFNVSHSQDLALIAFARESEIGVDVEAVREPVDHVAIARRFFAPAEVMALLALPEAWRTAAFFEVWTRKEAYLKLDGGGLGVGLDSFEVSLGGSPRLLRDARDPTAPGRVTLAIPDVPKGFEAAIAVFGAARLRTRRVELPEILGSAAGVL